MGNILRACFKGEEDHGGDHYPYYRPTSRPHYQPQHCGDDQPAAASWPRPHQQALGPHGVAEATAGVAALAQDLLNFESTSMVPEGLGQNVTSSKKAQVKWYRNILEVYKNTRPPPKTPAEAAQLVATALSRIQRVDLEGVLAFYNLPIPSLPAASASSGHHPSSLPEGIQSVLNTLPVNNMCIGDGDGFTAYVDTTDPRESANVPLEVHEMVIARTQARTDRDYKTADALLRSLDKSGYKIITISGEEILTRKYRIRMRGIDAPELEMPYGEESKNALVKLIGGRSVTIYVYDQDQFGRYVGDIYCDNVFIQEKMLKSGHVWHFKNYDQRPEFAKWEREARAAHRGLWASDSPEKPWDWRRKQRRAGHDAIQVY
ncbi:probable staphylococcal-like nuclease CAN2 [Phragmites australis]|uniref:probable staphylococcal-like nuclease CAN2 n=1 Tax=Phragmites australis TaxID=29695 RepID=UPI002D7A4027|nr:probable staphylococcal-like nuclease CAN2 [Phragmites australis]